MTDTYVLILIAMGLSLAALAAFLIWGQATITVVAQSAVGTLSVGVFGIGILGLLLGPPAQIQEQYCLFVGGVEALAIALSPLWATRLKYGTWSLPHGS